MTNFKLNFLLKPFVPMGKILDIASVSVSTFKKSKLSVFGTTSSIVLEISKEKSA